MLFARIPRPCVNFAGIIALKIPHVPERSGIRVRNIPERRAKFGGECAENLRRIRFSNVPHNYTSQIRRLQTAVFIPWRKAREIDRKINIPYMTDKRPPKTVGNMQKTAKGALRKGEKRVKMQVPFQRIAQTPPYVAVNCGFLR